METLQSAIERANKISKGNYPETAFVVYVPGDQYGPYDVCFEHDLDTYYAGIRDHQIVYCTDE